MKMKIVSLSLIAVAVFTQAQTHLKQSDLKDFSIGKDMEKHEAQNVKYKDGKPLSPGKYIVLMDEEGRSAAGLISLFEVNNAGKIDGEMSFQMPNKSLESTALYQDDILVKIDKKIDGKLIETSYFDQGIFYEKEFDENGDFKRESRSKDGKRIYSKSMNLSGWDVEDEIKGTRTFYYGKTDIIESRSSSKNLEKDATWMEERFDEKGKLIAKEIKYGDDKRKVINRDGSYELIIATDGGDKVSQYSSKGKLLKTYVAAYPTMSVQ